VIPDGPERPTENRGKWLMIGYQRKFTCKQVIIEFAHAPDNTDQLGNKVTTSIKNQAVNKTEGLLNNSVNEFKLLRVINRKSIKRKCD
jgi:hypothetical protein